MHLLALLLSGIVLQVNAGGTAVVHHAAFGGMPAMTMAFRVPAAPPLAPGERITAQVDTRSEPWTLSRVRIAADVVATPAPITPAVAAGEPLPATAFVDQRGRPFSLESLRGRAYALSFVYTRCRDARMCPLISAKYRLLQARLSGAQALVEVTLDPRYDTPAVLARYGRTFGADPARWHLLTGEPGAVARFVERLGVDERRAGATVIHTERLAVIAPDGGVARFIDDATWTPAEVAAALGDAAAPRSSPLRHDVVAGLLLLLAAAAAALARGPVGRPLHRSL